MEWQSPEVKVDVMWRFDSEGKQGLGSNPVGSQAAGRKSSRSHLLIPFHVHFCNTKQC